MKEIPQSIKRGFCRKIMTDNISIFIDNIVMEQDKTIQPVDRNEYNWIKVWQSQGTIDQCIKVFETCVGPLTGPTVDDKIRQINQWINHDADWFLD